jgi:hypothetical protein
MKLLPESAEVNRNTNAELTFEEVAEIMTSRGYPMSAGAAWHTERRALRKIAQHPEIVKAAEEIGIIPTTE